MNKYIPSKIEPKWQNKWREDKLFSPNLDQAAKPFYNLMMFPYPSAEGLHVGNMYPFTGSDIFGRFKKMQGFDVFEPIGLDGFGIHSENYALRVNEHPMELSKVTEKRFYEQLAMIGDAYDWNRVVETYKPNYYRWTQWLFLKMFQKGLAYRQKASVNWCPEDKTVLADEQVINGLCERCDSRVEQKMLEQWFFRITDYADRLLKNLETIDWSEKVKIAQRNWIGKKEGALVEFKIAGADQSIEVFTTRPDTLHGATFLVVSPEHPLVSELFGNTDKIKEYIAKAKARSEQDRIAEGKDKSGVATDFTAINPVNNEEIPTWIADYVLLSYGTGAIMAVPAHDQRDFEFAKKFDLPIKQVIEGQMKDGAYEGEGNIINSKEWNGWKSSDLGRVIDFLKEKGIGKRKTNYHLRDWLISRQRYWGPPIPIIYCDKCGTVPVPEQDLPVELPYVENFRPTGTGKSPLASVESFYKVSCPKCGGQARRETDVSDTFLDSGWYFLRYPSTEFDKVAFDDKRTKKWLPVEMYIGGAEHSVLHLLYSRFVTMVLNDLGLIDFEEPFNTFFAHGLIIKDGAKMSKSKGNVINPDEYIKEYGADTFRMYLMFMGPLSEGGDFRERGINGIYRFLQRIWVLADKVDVNLQGDALEAQSLRIMHKTIKKVTEDIEAIKFNTAIAALMEWLNHLSRKETVSVEEYKTFLLLLAPFAPHITEELWQMVIQKDSEELRKPEDQNVRKSDILDIRSSDLSDTLSHSECSGNWSIHKQSWPKIDNKYLEEEELSVAIQVNGKVRDILVIGKELVNNKEVVEKIAKKSKKAQKFLAGKSVEKVVYIPGKIISFVVGS